MRKIVAGAAGTGGAGGCAWPFVADCEAAVVAPVGWNDGSNNGRSGCIVVAFVSSVTRRPGGRLEKYFCLCCQVFVSILSITVIRKITAHTSSVEAFSTETNPTTCDSGTG